MLESRLIIDFRSRAESSSVFITRLLPRALKPLFPIFCGIFSRHGRIDLAPGHADGVPDLKEPLSSYDSYGIVSKLLRNHVLKSVF